MGRDGVVSGYPTPTGFRKLMGCQRDPRDKGVTSLMSEKQVKEFKSRAVSPSSI